MKKTRSPVLHRAMLGASALALAALPARAALKYQPCDYVQDGLIVHLDGIANVGADAPHDPGANVWANLADANNPAKITDNSSSGWRNGSGYYFCWASAASYAQLAYATPAMTEASFEFVIDGSGSYTWGNTIFSATNDQKVCTANSTADYTFKADQWTGNSTRPILKGWSWKQASFTLAPSGAGNFKGYDQGVAKAAGNASTTGVNNIPDTAWMVGQKNGQLDQARQFVGVVKSFRIYNRALTAEEVAQNAAIDAARFDGVIPVTNAVVATAVSGAFGNEVPGVYAVDGSHTFTAGPSAKVGSSTYACTGCTVETWENGAWSAPVQRDGVFAVEVSASDKVRITWNWSAATGTLGSGIDAYSTDGIKVWFDGICNAGKGISHASDGAWRELVSNSTANMSTNANSHWTDDGYYFAVGPNSEKSYVYLRQLVSLGNVGTIELACDTKANDQTAAWAKYLTFGYTSTGWNASYENGMGIMVNAKQTFLRFTDDAWTGNKEADYTGTEYANWQYRANTTSPWDGKHAAFVVDTDNHRSYRLGVRDAVKPRKTLQAMPAAFWMMGNTYYNGSVGNDQLVGTMKAVRAYGRVLSDAEISRHYSIDVWRFDGIVPLSNAVEVVADPRGLVGREPAGVYFPEGWTFAAGSATQTVGTVSYVCGGYILETWDPATTNWCVRGSYESCSYTSPASAPFATVRLTWLWEPVAGIRAASGYTIGDYVRGGIAVWFDGICNDGVDAPHVSDSSHRWRELVSGQQANMGVNENSGWEDDGYRFAAGANNEKSYAYLRKFVSLGDVGTIELSCDINAADQSAEWPKPLTFGATSDTTDNSMAIQTYRTGTYLRFQDDAWTGNSETAWAGTEWANWKYRVSTSEYPGGRFGHAAFVVDTDNHRTYRNGTRDNVTTCRKTVQPMPAAYWMIGNKYSASDAKSDQLVGTMKAVRAYNRVLSDAEIAQNYKVDVARFDGALTTTNVVVAASDYNGDLAADAYEVYGSHVFEGANSAIDGSAPNRVKVWTLENGAWTGPEVVNGGAYTYTAGTSPATVKIEFGKTNPFVLIVR